MNDSKTSLSSSNIDSISLVQALRDFDVANARVLDLTQRLLESERQRKNLADELERLRLQISTSHQPPPPMTMPDKQANWIDAARAVKRLVQKSIKKIRVR